MLQFQFQLQLLILLLPVRVVLLCWSGAYARRLDKPNRPMQQRADTQQLMLPAQGGSADWRPHCTPWVSSIIDRNYRSDSIHTFCRSCSQRTADAMARNPAITQWVFVQVGTNQHAARAAPSAMAAAEIATMRQGERTDLAHKCAKSQSDVADGLKVSRRSPAGCRFTETFHFANPREPSRDTTGPSDNRQDIAMPTKPPQHRPGALPIPAHRPQQTDRQSRRAYNTGSRPWRQLRQKVLVRDGYACVMCGLISESNHVDHIDGDSHHNAMANLRTLCQPCHAAHGAGPGRKAKAAVGADGWPVEPVSDKGTASRRRLVYA